MKLDKLCYKQIHLVINRVYNSYPMNVSSLSLSLHIIYVCCRSERCRLFIFMPQCGHCEILSAGNYFARLRCLSEVELHTQRWFINCCHTTRFNFYYNLLFWQPNFQTLMLPYQSTSLGEDLPCIVTVFSVKLVSIPNVWRMALLRLVYHNDVQSTY